MNQPASGRPQLESIARIEAAINMRPDRSQTSTGPVEADAFVQYAEAPSLANAYGDMIDSCQTRIVMAALRVINL